ncbi:putative reverse transcriptase domain-containing protein [Tanacetum coccineum]
MLGAEEARQDPNIMTGMFTLNNHYATTLFDSGADYSFVSTTFIPLLDIEPSDLGFSYESEIASRQLVKIDKVIRGCKLEIEGHVFDINLIPIGSGSFDVIIGMDWLSDYKAEIICHEKVVRILLLDDKLKSFIEMGESDTKYNWERIRIMPPKMTTRSAGRATAAPRGGRTGERTGRGSGRTGGQSGDQGDGRNDGQGGQVGDQGRGQGNGRNQNNDAVNDHIRGDVRNDIKNKDRRGCTYKEFLACNPKEYDGERGAIVYTRWIKKTESVQDMSGCKDSQKVKYTAGSFTLTREELCPSNEMKKLETELWNHAMVGVGHAAYTDRFHELARLVPHLVTPKGPGGNRPNQALANNRGQGRGNQGNLTRGRAFMLGPDEACQDPNIVTGTFTLNHHYATTLFDSGADYSFVSTTFIPMLDIEPIDLGFSYEIEIASGQIVKIDKVIRGCKLEIEGHVFDINLIPFGSGSFDVIIGMDWLSDYKAEIICHEKVVRILLLDDKVLKVFGEKPEDKVRQLMSAKAKEKKQ